MSWKIQDIDLTRQILCKLKKDSILKNNNIIKK